MAAPLALIPIAIRLILAGIGIGGAAFGLKKMNDIGEKKMFNRGVCPKCGGHFKYVQEVTGSRAYKCDFCSYAVLISQDVDKEYSYTPSRISKK